jgi:outer membrane protein TolC
MYVAGTRRRRLGLILAIALCGPQAGRAVDDPVDVPSPEVTEPDAEPLPEAAATAGIGSTAPVERVQLSLAEAIATSLERNLAVEVERFSPHIAFEESEAAWGSYDPELYGEYDYLSTENPVASAFQNARRLKERKLSGSGGLRGLVPAWGASYAVTYAGQRLKTESAVQTLSPEYRSNLYFTLTTPLLKGLLWGEPWTRVKTSRVQWEQAGESFRTNIMEVVLGVETAYWNVVATEEALRAAEKSVEASRALLEQARAQYEVGVESRVAVTEAEAGVAEREFNYITALNRYRTAQDRIVDLVYGTRLTATSVTEIEPLDRPEDYTVFQVDTEVSVNKAFEKRPELALALKEVERQQLQLRFANNQLLPKLDVSATYGYQGIAGEENPDRTDFSASNRALVAEINDKIAGPLVASGNPNFDRLNQPPDTRPIDIEDRYSQTHKRYFEADGNKYREVKGILSIPLGNITGRHRKSQAELQLRQARSKVRQTEQRIVVEVRNAVRDILTGQDGIEAAERRRAAAAEQFRAERIRLEQGESTPFNVLQKEEDLFEAERQKIDALEFYRVSVAKLERAQGTILESRHIEIEEVGELR